MHSEESDYSLVPFFESSPDFLCIAGFDGYFKAINPAFCKLLGYSKEELLDRPINDFVHPDDQDLTHKHRKRIWAGKPLLNFENRYITNDGRFIWLSWNSIPRNDDRLVYAIAKDITYFKEHEEKRNQLLAELTRNNERLKQLNYATSHDLRSPVCNLLSVFSLLNTSQIADRETLEFIDILKASTEALKNTLDRYVDDLQQHDRQLPVENADLKRVIDEVRRSLKNLILESHATFQIQLTDFDAVDFNYAYLESIFLNLITNSLKYAHPDRAPVISIRTGRSEQYKQLIFSDNGSGFDSNALQGRIFGLHEKFHEHRDSKGIGLYLVHNHMTSLGGTVSVESQVNAGTTFTLCFKVIS